MINRRELIKNAALMGLASIIPSVAKSNNTKATGTSAPIAELFSKFDTTEYNWVPYPVDIVAPHIEAKRGIWIENANSLNVNNIPSIDGDYFGIPLFDMEKPTQEELQNSINEEALKIIIASAYDRNIVVFDNDKGDYSSVRSSSSVTFKRNGGKNRNITHIIQTSPSRRKYPSINEPTIIEVDREYFTNLICQMGFDFILGNPTLKYPNWGIAVDNSRYELVMPIYSHPINKNGLWHTRRGFASLNNESILLFNYGD